MTPEVRVVRGEPDDVELAALVAGLAATAAGEVPGARHTASPATAAHAAARRWRAAARPGAHASSSALRPGPDAWRWSAQG